MSTGLYSLCHAQSGEYRVMAFYIRLLALDNGHRNSKWKIVIRILNLDRNPDHPQNSMAYPMI